MTALASSKLRLLIRSTISTHTAARTCGPASRQAGIAARAAASAGVDVERAGSVTPSVGP